MIKKSIKIITVVLSIFIFAFILSFPAFGTLRVSPPEFETGYRLPNTIVPYPRSNNYEYLDALVLFIVLILTAYFALRKRSRKDIFMLMIFSLVYFGFIKKGCICSIGSIQNISLALFNHTYFLPIPVLIFFILPLLFSLFFGRVFCAAACPIGAIQDIIIFHPLKIPKWLNHALSMFPAIYLGLAVLYAAMSSHFIICRFDPFVSFFRLSGSAVMLLFGAIFLFISMFIARPYCRFLCPYGVLLRWLSRISKWHVKITPDECIQCRLCEESCPLGAIQIPQKEDRRPFTDELRRIIILIIIFPFIITLGAFIGKNLATPLSLADRRIRLAEQIWNEDAGIKEELTVESETFRSTGRPVADLYREVLLLKKQYQFGGLLFGAFIGLTFGGTLISLSHYRGEVDYEPDKVLCISCGRCFAYCPKEHQRLKTMKENYDSSSQKS